MQLNLFDTQNEINEDIIAKISQRRRQILVHSCIYYRFGDNIIDDFKYDKFARELAKLQQEYPEESSKAVYANHFKEFGQDGCYSGFNLPTHLPEIVNKAYQLLKYRDRYETR